MPRRTRIAVLGGGPGGLSAAWHLAAQQRDDLEITLHTMGWRLGGKGAAGATRKWLPSPFQSTGTRPCPPT